MNNSAPNPTASRKQPFSAKKFCIGSLRNGQKLYVIPAYQRPYAWTSTQVVQLMQDLLDFYRNAPADCAYSLGTIVCDEEMPGVFSILDGQQRLTTIDLLLREISHRLGRPIGDAKDRIISAYRYLGGMETSNESPLPACTRQRVSIEQALSGFIDKWQLRDDQNLESFLKSFEACILDRVNVRRVVIPLSDKVENEAPAMFEIINMRGQKLSPLDILKSRLLARFHENDHFGRALFSHLWRSTEELLNSPQKAAEGYNLKGWNRPQKKLLESDARVCQTLIPPELTISEIIADPCAISAASVTQTGKNGKTQAKTDQNEAADTENVQFAPPIDMMNMLVIANELLKYKKAETSIEKDAPILAPQALATTDFADRFDHIVQSETDGAADVWRLMGALSIVLQTVGNWGRYRTAETEQFEGAPEAFNQLVQTFMASNSFSDSAQYWLLVLSTTALESSLGKNGELPADPDAFLTMKNPAFGKIRKLALLRLLTWAYRVAELGQDHATEAVFNLIKETESENVARDKLKDAQAAVEAAALNWQYKNGGISQFDLFLTDYVLWVDGHASGQQRFASLSAAMKSFADNAQTKEEIEIADAFRSFDRSCFAEKAQNLRIVARSDIEHWLARNRADLGKDSEEADEELDRRQGFGNLALINQSDNSTLGNGAPAGKAEIVLMRMSNPTPKLLWLAVLSQVFANMSGKHVEGLTKLWAAYIGRFEFF